MKLRTGLLATLALTALLSADCGKSDGTATPAANCTSSYGAGQVVFGSLTAVDGSWNGTASGSRNLWTMNPDGSGAKVLTHNTNSGLNSYVPRFSPDGTKIAFYSYTALDGSWNGSAAGSLNLWIMNSDGSNRIALTKNSNAGLDVSTFSFSPDGTQIAFGAPLPLAGGWNGTPTGSSNIWVVKTDGTGLTPLTRNTAASRDAGSPFYSPDGTKIFFASLNALDGTWTGTAALSNNLWRINPDGTGLTALTKNQNVNLDVQADFSVTSASPTRILWYSRTARDSSWDGTGNSTFNIWVSDYDGNHRIDLTSSALVDYSAPRFTPDYTKIVYLTNGLLNGSTTASVSSNNVWVMSSDGSNSMPLTQNTNGVFTNNPAVSSDGKSALFLSATHMDASGNAVWSTAATPSWNIWRASLDASSAAAITRNTTGAADQYKSVDSSGGLVWFQPKTCL
jgi:Tol biopolymer transport system component